MKRRSFIAGVLAMLGLGKMAPAAAEPLKMKFTQIHTSMLSKEWWHLSSPFHQMPLYASKTITIRYRAIGVDKMKMICKYKSGY